MTACDTNDFPYEPAPTPASAELRDVWDAAIGLQETDGLKPSAYLRATADETVAGTMPFAAATAAVRTYYRERDAEKTASDQEEREADLVSCRIAELLARRGFFLAPTMLFSIHRYLFQDLDDATYAPGRPKTEALAKKETILNGDSVLYGAPEFIDGALKLFFDREATRAYSAAMAPDELRGFCEFITHIWQVHPFKEGNTRTVAVFSALYLDYLGFDTSNEPFARHARYFRDALVRANYRNAKADVMPDLAFLVRFYENMLHDAGHALRSKDLVCPALFERPELLRNMPAAEALTKPEQ